METNPEVCPAPDHHAPTEGGAGHDVDLDAIEHELHQVEATLARLDDDSYWADEETGEPDDPERHAESPSAAPSPSQPAPDRFAPSHHQNWPDEDPAERNTVQ